MARELKPCGTNAAYLRHIRAGETPCEPCQKAHREYVPTTRRSVRCGTNSGYVSHQRRGEMPCDPCKTAHANYIRQYRSGRAS